MRRQNNKGSGESKSNENRTKLQDVKRCGRRNAWRQTVNGGKQRGGKGTEGGKNESTFFNHLHNELAAKTRFH